LQPGRSRAVENTREKRILYLGKACIKERPYGVEQEAEHISYCISFRVPLESEKEKLT